MILYLSVLKERKRLRSFSHQLGNSLCNPLLSFRRKAQPTHNGPLPIFTGNRHGKE